MSNSAKLQNIIIILLVVSIIGMSIGFASLNANLQITDSNATFEKATWGVVFDSLSETENNADGTANISGNTLSYDVTLKPNSSYTINVNAKNVGTIDAKLTGITFSGTSPADIDEKVQYTFSYGGVTYNTDQTGLAVDLPAVTNNTKPIVITLTYPAPSSTGDLFDTDTTVHLGVTLSYTSKDF